MKILLYFEQQKRIKQSGIGRALSHQIKALQSVGIDYTLDITDDFDIAHINTLFPRSYRVLKKCKKRGIPVIVHGHSTKEDFRNSFRAWKLIKPFFYSCMLKMYRQADYIVTPTPYSKKLIEGYKGVKCPVYVASNGIDLSEYAYSEEEVKKFRETYHITNQRVVVGAGLYFARKGLYDFFAVAKKMPNVTFIWFGFLKGLMTQKKILKAINNRPSNVMMPGYADIKGALMACDCFFFPSFEETEGIVVLEALAAKAPTVVRKIGVYEPWLVDSKSTFMACDVEGFVKKIRYVLNNKTAEVTKQGYEIVEQRSIDKIGAHLAEIYDKVSKDK